MFINFEHKTENQPILVSKGTLNNITFTTAICKVLNHYTESYLGHCQVSMIKHLAKIIYGV